MIHTSGTTKLSRITAFTCWMYTSQGIEVSPGANVYIYRHFKGAELQDCIQLLIYRDLRLWYVCFHDAVLLGCIQLKLPLEKILPSLKYSTLQFYRRCHRRFQTSYVLILTTCLSTSSFYIHPREYQNRSSQARNAEPH